jgi:hypothetical protein
VLRSLIPLIFFIVKSLFKDRAREPVVDTFSLQETLQDCTDPSSPSFDRAWNSFIDKYKNYIYKVIHNRCQLWHQDRGPSDLSDTVNDAANEVFLLLYRRNGRALSQFKAIHSETAFRGYLATISDRVARRTLQREKIYASFDDSLQIKDKSISQESRWQVFDYLVSILRFKAGKQERNIERNILLFNLYTLEDYTKEMLQKPPVFRGLGHRVVDNVVGRSREKLNIDDKNNLRELLGE